MSAPRMSQKEYEAYLARIRGKSASCARRAGRTARSSDVAADAGNARSCASQLTRDEYRRRLDEKNGTKIPVGSEWSGSEKRYYYGVLRGAGQYEGETIRITPDNFERHEYTPDFVTKTSSGTTVYHEVKGHYSFKNQCEARLRWCFAALARPDAIFVWAKEDRSPSRWSIDVMYDGGRTHVRARGVVNLDIGYVHKGVLPVVVA